MIWILIDSGSVGGIERHVATLAAALNRAGQCAEVVLMADHGANPWLRQLEAGGIPFRILQGPGSLWRALSASRPDVLHTHGYKANMLARLIAPLLAIPHVSTFHAGERGAFPVSLYLLADAWTAAWGGRIAVSAKIQAALPFGADLVENFMLAPLSAPSGPLPRRIGFVGRLSHEKGPDWFCELAARCPDAGEWHVWGDGPMRAELEARFGRHVTFHGLVTDLAPVWASLGLLAMPSRAEGLPMAALEALAAGVPMVASDTGGLPSVVTPGKTGWLFPVGDLDAAERAVRAWMALDEATAAGMRRTAYELLRDGFSDQRQLPKVLAVYEREKARTAARMWTSRPAGTLQS